MGKREKPALNEIGKLLFVYIYKPWRTKPLFRGYADVKRAIIADPAPSALNKKPHHLHRQITKATTGYEALPLPLQFALEAAVETRLWDKTKTTLKIARRVSRAIANQGRWSRQSSRIATILFERRYPECHNEFGPQPLFDNLHELSRLIAVGPKLEISQNPNNIATRVGLILDGQSPSRTMLSAIEGAIRQKYPHQRKFTAWIMEGLTLEAGTRKGKPPTEAQKILFWYRYPQCANAFGHQPLFNGREELLISAKAVPHPDAIGHGALNNGIGHLVSEKPTQPAIFDIVATAIRRKVPKHPVFADIVIAQLSKNVVIAGRRPPDNAGQEPPHGNVLYNEALSTLDNAGLTPEQIQNPGIIHQLKMYVGAMTRLEDHGVGPERIRDADPRRMRAALVDLTS